MNEACGPMGLRKDLHIKALTENPAIAERWKSVTGALPGEADKESMFADLVPLQQECS